MRKGEPRAVVRERRRLRRAIKKAIRQERRRQIKQAAELTRADFNPNRAVLVTIAFPRTKKEGE